MREMETCLHFLAIFSTMSEIHNLFLILPQRCSLDASRNPSLSLFVGEEDCVTPLKDTCVEGFPSIRQLSVNFADQLKSVISQLPLNTFHPVEHDQMQCET